MRVTGSSPASLTLFLTVLRRLGLLTGLAAVVEVSANNVRELCLAGRRVGEGLTSRPRLAKQLGHQHLGHWVRVTLLIPVPRWGAAVTWGQTKKHTHTRMEWNNIFGEIVSSSRQRYSAMLLKNMFSFKYFFWSTQKLGLSGPWKVPRSIAKLWNYLLERKYPKEDSQKIVILTKTKFCIINISYFKLFWDIWFFKGNKLSLLAL